MFRLGGWERNQPSKSQAAQCGTDPWSSGGSGEGLQASLAAGKALYPFLYSWRHREIPFWHWGRKDILLLLSCLRWGLGTRCVNAAWEAGACCLLGPSARAQPVLDALCSPWRSALGTGGPGEVSLPGRGAGCWQHRMHAVSWEIQWDLFLSAGLLGQQN